MLIEDRIETPENVELRRKLAGIGLRFQAGLLDTLILAFAVYLPLFVIFFLWDLAALFADEATLEGLALAALIILIFCIYWGYFTLFELWMNGQTPGKKLMKIRVVRQEGQSLTFQAILIRNLLRVVDSIAGYAVAGISMFFSPRVQRLGDIAAGTVVISEQVIDYSAAGDSKQHIYIDEKLIAATLEQSGIKPEEFRLLYNYWMRKDQLDPMAKARLLPKILMPILERRGETVEPMLVANMEYKIERLMSGIQARADRTQTETPTPETTPDAPFLEEPLS